MNIDIKEMKRVDLFAVSGRIDSSSAPELGVALNNQIDGGTTNIIVDLAGVEYMSSAGLRELVAALKRVKNVGGDLRLCSPSVRAAEVLDLAGLRSIFQIFDSTTSAVGSF